jgi:hypothetical protein
MRSRKNGFGSANQALNTASVDSMRLVFGSPRHGGRGQRKPAPRIAFAILLLLDVARPFLPLGIYTRGQP